MTLEPCHLEVDETETRLLLEGIRLKYGYDFRDYAEASMNRRVSSILRHFQVREPLDILRQILRDPGFFQQVLAHLTVTTSEMFRDPPFFKLLREKVVPVLKTYPTVNIWSAGCSTGEEIYSLAILLKEEDLFDRSVIYATDINPRAIKAAQAGVYRAEDIKKSIRNYQEAGGKESFGQYYTADYGLVKMSSDLIANTVFSEHNLVTDEVFVESQLVLCRNVLIYFNRDLQDRAIRLFEESLRFGGYLGIGSKETLRFSRSRDAFVPLEEKWRLYRKIRHQAVHHA